MKVTYLQDKNTPVVSLELTRNELLALRAAAGGIEPYVFEHSAEAEGDGEVADALWEALPYDELTEAVDGL